MNLAKIAPETAARIAESQRIIRFRHILVHGYDAIDRDITWAVVSEKLPGLARQVERLLAETESDPRPL